MNDFFLNKTALITGAGSGIGLAVSKRFHELGCKLVLIDKDLSSINEAYSNDGNTLFVKADLSDGSNIQSAFKKINDKISKLDIAFNAAGIGGASDTVENYSLENWQEVMNININAVFLCMKYEIPLIKKAGRGSIVNCASLLSKVGFANDSAYVASKHAVIGLTKSAALEYANQGIKINAVSPGFTATAMTKNYDSVTRRNIEAKHALNRFATVDEIANAVVWLCSDESSFVCGHNLVVDGGYVIQ